MSNSMFHKGKGYQTLAGEDVDPILKPASIVGLSYKTPASELGIFSEQGITYLDIKGQDVLIPKAEIPTFLRNLRCSETPWHQWEFAAIFREGQQAMPGFEQSLLDEGHSGAIIDYWLIMLGARAGQLQVAKSGQDRQKKLCPESMRLVILYNTLHEELEAYQKLLNELQQKEERSRHSDEQYKTLSDHFKTQWTTSIEKVTKLYQKDLDTKNILLNLAAMASFFGLIVLIYKNVSLWKEGKSPAFFQFAQAHSRTVTQLNQLRADVCSTPRTSFHNFFSSDISDTFKSIKALSTILSEFKLAIDKSSSGESDRLHQLHEYLLKDLMDLSQQITETVDERTGHKDDTEALFITKWKDTVGLVIPLLDPKDVYSQEIQKSLKAIEEVTTQLDKEFQSDPRYQLYAGGPKK